MSATPSKPRCSSASARPPRTTCGSRSRTPVRASTASSTTTATRAREAPAPAQAQRSNADRAPSAGPAVATGAARKVERTRAMTHQITGVGLAATGAAAAHATTTTALVLLGGAWVGSLLPDADLAGARVYRRTRVERRLLLVRAVGAVVRLPLRLLTMFRHRGVTHSVLACALATVAAGGLVRLAAPAVAITAAIGVAAGYGAHIAADACTPSGVPLWAPLSRRRRWLLPASARIPTGSLREYALAALLTAALITASALLAG